MNEVCGVEMAPGVYCLREPHEDETHQYDVPLPPAVNRMVAAKMDELDHHIEVLKKQSRRSTISWRWAMVAVGVNAAAAIFSLMRYHG